MSLRKFIKRNKAQNQTADPVAAEQFFSKGAEHKRPGNFTEAESCSRRAIATFPGHGQTWNNIDNLFTSNRLPGGRSMNRISGSLLKGLEVSAD